MIIESTRAGPANCAAAVPVMTKMPAPIMAPMPSVVRLNPPSPRRSVPDSASAMSSAMGFRVRRLIPHHAGALRPARAPPVRELSEICQALRLRSAQAIARRLNGAKIRFDVVHPPHAAYDTATLLRRAAGASPSLHARPGGDAG